MSIYEDSCGFMNIFMSVHGYFLGIYEYLEAMEPMMAPRWREVAAQWQQDAKMGPMEVPLGSF